MDPVTIDTLVQLARANAWIPMLAVVVGAFIRVAKDDPLVARIPVYIRPENRGLWAMGLAVVGAALDRLAAGGTWYDAIAGGVVAGSVAIAGHEIVVNRLRKGRDLGVKKDPPAPPSDWEDDSIRPPPTRGTVYPSPPSHYPLAAVVVAWMAAVVVTACAGTGRVVCPVIDLASNLCPLVLVKMPDGSTERVPSELVKFVTVQYRAARIEVEQRRADAGATDGGAE
jgi:hypothetical protein